MPVAQGWKQPRLPEGPLRTLNEALHELHALSGYLSSRNIAGRIRDRADCDPISHTTVRTTLTDAGLPRLSYVMSIVQVLADFDRGADPDSWLDRFDGLWQRARSAGPDPVHLNGLSLEEAAGVAQRLHEQRAALLKEQLSAEHEFVRQAAALLAEDKPDWWGLLNAYDQVKAWAVEGYFGRWREQIGFDRPAIHRLALASPRSADGTWAGSTGWEGMDGTQIPPRRSEVVYALFDGHDRPIYVGMTSQFRAQTKRLHRQGHVWASWKAWPCADRADAVRRRREVIERYRLDAEPL